jgi:hypothetical protein
MALLDCRGVRVGPRRGGPKRSRRLKRAGGSAILATGDERGSSEEAVACGVS